MVYYVFDLLHLDGFDTRAAPLIDRKRVLQGFLTEAQASAPRVLYSEHFEDGAARQRQRDQRHKEQHDQIQIKQDVE